MVYVYADRNCSASDQLQDLVEEINTTVLSNKRSRKAAVSDWTERIEHMEENWESIRCMLFEYTTVGAAPPAIRVCN